MGEIAPYTLTKRMAYRVHLLCGEICPTLFWPDRPYSLVCLGYTWATAKIEVGGIVAITGKVYFLKLLVKI